MAVAGLWASITSRLITGASRPVPWEPGARLAAWSARNFSLTDEVASGSKLTVSWISVDSGGVAPANYKIDEASFEIGKIENHIDASISKPDAGWPVGTYQVQIAVDGTMKEAVDFSVK